MIHEEEPQEDIFDNDLSDADKTALLEISKWIRLISVIGFAIGAFVVVLMLFSGSQILQTAVTSIPSLKGMYGVLVAVFFVAFFIAAVVLYYLYKASQLLLQGIQQQNDALLSQAFVYLKNFFIAVIIFVGLRLIINLSNFFNSCCLINNFRTKDLYGINIFYLPQK
ncbi:hypothetical protein [Niabella hibiscisoli]|uniref:hypothetical protein n=1 Tax=Niabella hibiscisoli TaxID=1825928 RepID=UPI001F0D0CA3|nr:hypothetical protein [Niabella hibiscisoli]MCH5716804.1 hypothetical protein [Niabella hibiscisoli]